MTREVPRLVVAGLSGDSGKTLISLGVIAALRRRGLSVSAFKKGPDYIDAAWLAWISQGTARNLDTYLVPSDSVRQTYCDHTRGHDIAIIEGNRGLYDGRGSSGIHSTAELALLLRAPVVLVVNAGKATRTLAAVINGCVSFEPRLRVAGVILNRVAGERHRKTIIDSIAQYCEVPVLGAVPRVDCAEALLPSRHLGLVTPAEHGHAAHQMASCLDEIGARYLDVDRLLECARDAEPMEEPAPPVSAEPVRRARVGYFRDSVFTFYYPENLEELAAQGAELVPISSLHDPSLPDIDALYIGGGFPEVHAERLARNRPLMDAVRRASATGLPIYAECGGLIYLSRAITFQGTTYPMSGVFDIALTMHAAPVGHGYTAVRVDRPCPFFPNGTEIRGHEFHYSAAAERLPKSVGCMKMVEGIGLGNGRDGLLSNHTLACYTHLHALGVPGWAEAMVRCAQEYRQGRPSGADAAGDPARVRQAHEGEQRSRARRIQKGAAGLKPHVLTTRS
ncbi:MAG: cobyrinate a,c-diamide synthase [Candidatus Zixiibacteriota bacterium]